MKAKLKVMAFAIASMFFSLNMNAALEVGGTCTSWQTYPDHDVITCAPSPNVCFGITDDGDLYVGLDHTTHHISNVVNISPNTWRLNF